MSKGLLIVVSAPSGCGKGTILERVLGQGNFFYSVSATTRLPRAGEIEGVNYFFMSEDKFKELAESGGMLEYARYCGNYYGTPAKAVEDRLAEGKDVILEIDVQGAAAVREKCPDAVFIFILPPSAEVLRERLEKRGTESAEFIEQRVGRAAGEMEYAYNYDYVIVNDELDKAVSDFIKVVDAEKLSCRRCTGIIDGIRGLDARG